MLALTAQGGGKKVQGSDDEGEFRGEAPPSKTRQANKSTETATRGQLWMENELTDR
jgi:hypothetical protein